MNQWHETVREYPQIPLRYAGLIRKRISSLRIYGTEACIRFEYIHKRARTVINGLSCNTHVVGIHDSVNKSNTHPFNNQFNLRMNQFLQ